jgi:hypothetical protein
MVSGALTLSTRSTSVTVSLRRPLRDVHASKIAQQEAVHIFELVGVEIVVSDHIEIVIDRQQTRVGRCCRVPERRRHNA